MSGRLDDMFEDAGRPEADPRLLERIAAKLAADARPVRPVASGWMRAAGLVAIAAAVAAAGAVLLGLRGLHRLGAGQAALILGLLLVLVALAGSVAAAQMVPGARRPVSAWVLMASSAGVLAVLFGLLLHDYSTVRFIPQGLACLTAGLLNALPAAALAWLVLRRGFVLDTVAAGAAAGLLAGLAGVVMLELHCPILQAPHVMVWHVAVIPAATLLGSVAGRLVRG